MQVLEAIKDLVTEANFDCSAAGFALQAMDSSHVSLVSMLLRADGFEHYRCDRSLSMGMHLGNMAKMLKVRSPQLAVAPSTLDCAAIRSDLPGVNSKFER